MNLWHLLHNPVESSMQFHIEYHNVSNKTLCSITALTSTTVRQAVCCQSRQYRPMEMLFSCLLVSTDHIYVHFFNVQPQLIHSTVECWIIFNRPHILYAELVCWEVRGFRGESENTTGAVLSENHCVSKYFDEIAHIQCLSKFRLLEISHLGLNKRFCFELDVLVGMFVTTSNMLQP